MTADDYLREVGFALRDLPWRQRRDLVADMREHLAELPADTDFRERLGPPEQYAAEMRAAAGLDRRRGAIAFLRARRPRTVVLTALALIVVGLAIGTFAWIQAYQPLAFGGAMGLPGGTKHDPLNNAFAIPIRPGQRFDIGLQVENTGRFTVRIVGLPLNMAALPFHGRVLMNGPVYRRGPNANKPFHPFDLQPGKGFWVQFDGVFDCGRLVQGSVISFSVPVRYTFLWRTSTAAVTPSQPVELTVPDGASCPATR